MKITEDKKIGEVVAMDYRLSGIFDHFGIDFCCGGGKSIREICETKEIDSSVLLEKINSLLNEPQGEVINYDSWPLDLLADYIEKKHHRYVREQIPTIQKFLDKLCKVHGNGNPELFKINELFAGAVTELTNHMIKEELILFPYVRQLVSNEKVDLPGFRSVESPISVMIAEHETEGERFRTIARLSDNYLPPDHACNTYRAAYALLKEFEKDLHLHIHLENNILFPKTIKHERNVEHKKAD